MIDPEVLGSLKRLVPIELIAWILALTKSPELYPSEPINTDISIGGQAVEDTTNAWVPSQIEVTTE